MSAQGFRLRERVVAGRLARPQGHRHGVSRSSLPFAPGNSFRAYCAQPAITRPRSLGRRRPGTACRPASPAQALARSSPRPGRVFSVLSVQHAWERNRAPVAGTVLRDRATRGPFTPVVCWCRSAACVNARMARRPSVGRVGCRVLGSPGRRLWPVSVSPASLWWQRLRGTRRAPCGPFRNPLRFAPAASVVNEPFVARRRYRVGMT